MAFSPYQGVTPPSAVSATSHNSERRGAITPYADTDGPVFLPARLEKQPPARTLPLLDAQGHPLIVPRPKRAVFQGGDFTIGRTLTICAAPFAPDESRAGDMRLVYPAPLEAAGPRVVAELHRFGDELHARTGTNVRFVQTPERCDLRVCIAPPGKPATASTLPPEGYKLLVQHGRILLMGRDQAGAFYGLQTLRQLRIRCADGRQAFAGADIWDWPTLKFRGAHIFVGKNALPFHKKLIERIFARFKMNALVIECEYTAWKSHPELHAPNSMPPDDLREEVAFARDRFIEPIPLVNSLGHSQWMFANKQHLELAEDPQKPYAYDASNPDTYRLLFDIYGETLDIFHPRYFHIGHDEVKIPGADIFGRYPHRPENISKGVTRLFVDDTNRLADWLRARHVRPMLWADMLLHESEGTSRPGGAPLTAANAPTLAEAQARRAQIPQEAILADWRYVAGSEQRNGLDVLRQAGFETLGCAWYQPGNIKGWAQQAAQNHALGTLQTTWAGYDSREDLLETEYKQFAAYVSAAENAWSANESTLSFSASDVFARAYRSEAEGKARTGWKLDLLHAANVQVTDANARAFTLAPYPAAERLSLDAFPRGILLGVLGLPAAVSLPIGAKADTLTFEHATLGGAENNALVGAYTVVFADGQRASIPLHYGYQIRDLNDSAPSNSFAATVAPIGAGGLHLTARRLRWPNPRPTVRIDRIEFRADNPTTAPILFGIVGDL